MHPSATLIGTVRIGARCYIDPGVVLRGDNGPIHILEAQPARWRHRARRTRQHHAHRATLSHRSRRGPDGCRVGVHAFVGINSVVMDQRDHRPRCLGGRDELRARRVRSAPRACSQLARRLASPRNKPEQIAAKRRSTQGYSRPGRHRPPIDAGRATAPAVSVSAPETMSTAQRAARWLARVGRRAAPQAESLTS